MPEPEQGGNFTRYTWERGNFSVACCRCFGLLGHDGKAHKVVAGLIKWEDYPAFQTVAEADAAAEKAGWSVKDDQGSNHRCPLCREAERLLKVKGERRGAYIDFRTGEQFL